MLYLNYIPFYSQILLWTLILTALKPKKLSHLRVIGCEYTGLLFVTTRSFYLTVPSAIDTSSPMFKSGFPLTCQIPELVKIGDGYNTGIKLYASLRQNAILLLQSFTNNN